MRKNTLVVAFTYIGTVVGAGFASGQEILQFFGLLGPSGIPAILLATVLFFLAGAGALELGRRLKPESHRKVLVKALGPRVATIIDVVLTFFLFAGFSAMVAGAGAAVSQETRLPWISGALLMVVLSVLAVSSGLQGAIGAISSLVPFLLAGVLAASMVTLAKTGFVLQHPPAGMSPAVKPWFLAGLTYASYNMLLSVPILAAAGTTLTSKKEAFSGALVGAAGLGICTLLVYAAIVSTFPESASYDVPMARLASALHPWGTWAYLFVFLIEVYTTAVASLYGFVTRIAHPGGTWFRPVTVISGIAATAAASVGFANFIRIVYPVSGFAGFILLATLTLMALQF